MAADTPFKRTIHEEFATFLERPTREAFRELIRTNLGERNELDFKMDWPDFSKIGRHVLGFANSGGGAIVFGVKQEDDNSLSSVGLPTLRDKTEVHEGIQAFLPSSVRWEVLDFHFTESEYGPIKGKKFQVLLVEDDSERLPFIAEADGDGTRRGAIYVRDGVATREASYEELQALINRRLETGHSTSRELAIKKHLDELEVLYGSIGRFAGLALGLIADDRMMESLFKKNPAYPPEDFDSFVARMIREKKTLIGRLLLGSAQGTA